MQHYKRSNGVTQATWPHSLRGIALQHSNYMGGRHSTIPFCRDSFTDLFDVEHWCSGYAKISSSLAAGDNVKSSLQLPFLREYIAANVDG